MTPTEDAVTALPDLSNGPTARLTEAIEYLVHAWSSGSAAGIPDAEMAQATLLTALAAMVRVHGEARTAELLQTLPTRVLSGEFRLERLLQ